MMGRQKKKYLHFTNGASIEFYNEEEVREPLRGSSPPPVLQDPLPEWMMYHLDFLRNPYWSPIHDIPLHLDRP
jgi:hypothetical protein